MLIKDTTPEILMRARILGMDNPSCDSCKHYNRKWTYLRPNESFCAYHAKDPEPNSTSIRYQLCVHWAPP